MTSAWDGLQQQKHIHVEDLEKLNQLFKSIVNIDLHNVDTKTLEDKMLKNHVAIYESPRQFAKDYYPFYDTAHFSLSRTSNSLSHIIIDDIFDAGSIDAWIESLIEIDTTYILEHGTIVVFDIENTKEVNDNE